MPHPLWTSIADLFRPRDPLATALGKLPLFADLNERQLREIGRIVHVRTYRAGETIFEVGEVGVAMYAILAGDVEIVQRREPPGENARLAKLAAGDLFGEMALLDPLPRPAAAVATSPAELAAIARPDWLDLIGRRPDIGVKVLLLLTRMIAERLIIADRQLSAAKSTAEGNELG